MKKWIAVVCILMLICTTLPSALAGNTVELSDYMYGDLVSTANMIGGLEWDGDWYYANDIEQAYIGRGVLLAGNDDDEIKLIALDQKNGYSLFGLEVGMDSGVLEPLYNLYPHRNCSVHPE